MVQFILLACYTSLVLFAVYLAMYFLRRERSEFLRGGRILSGQRHISFDALTSNRPYRTAYPRERAIAILEQIKGTQLDADIVDTFLSALNGRE